jgi:hypothetical protein
MAEDGSVSEEAARQIESEVVDDMYKTTVSKLSSRREQYKAVADTGQPAEGVNSEKYKSYLDDLRREYRSEKEEKIRNKSFEYDKSSRSHQEASFNGNFTMSNILGSNKEADSARLENEMRPRDKETVVVRNEIRNRAAFPINATTARSELLQENYGGDFNEFSERAIFKKSDHLKDQNGRKEDVDVLYSNDNLGKYHKIGHSAINLNEKDKKEIREELSGNQNGRLRYEGLPKDEFGGSSGNIRDYRDYPNTSRVLETGENSRIPPDYLPRKEEIYEKQRDKRPIFNSTTLAGNSDFDSKVNASPHSYKNDLRSNSSEKKLYNWIEDKVTDDGHKYKREKSKDPFEDKPSHRNEAPPNRDIPMTSSRNEPTRPPIRDRSPQCKDELAALRSERGKFEEKGQTFDKLYYTEREKRDDSRNRSPDLSPFPRVEPENSTIIGKSKRLETENHILLKNNSELRRENNELKEKLKDLDDINQLKDKIRELTEKNRRLELQAMSQQSSPLIMPKTPSVHTHQFFNDYGKSVDNGKLRGQSSEILLQNNQSYKHLPQTERRKLSKEQPGEKAAGTKLKFADSVLGMVRQLVDLTQGEEECKHAWKILKNMVGEYVDLKRESKMGFGSPILNKNGSANSETFDFKSTERARLRSEEKNRWRDRNPQQESKKLGSRPG